MKRLTLRFFVACLTFLVGSGLTTALLVQSQTHAPADWSNDAAIGELQLDGVDLGLIDFDGRFILLNYRKLRVQLLLNPPQRDSPLLARFICSGPFI